MLTNPDSPMPGDPNKECFFPDWRTEFIMGPRIEPKILCAKWSISLAALYKAKKEEDLDAKRQAYWAELITDNQRKAKEKLDTLYIDAIEEWEQLRQEIKEVMKPGKPKTAQEVRALSEALAKYTTTIITLRTGLGERHQKQGPSLFEKLDAKKTHPED